MAGLTAAAVAQALVVDAGDSGFHWTPATVVLAIFLFFLAGLCEIGGGWLVWQVLRFQLGPWKSPKSLRVFCSKSSMQIKSYARRWSKVVQIVRRCGNTCSDT